MTITFNCNYLWESFYWYHLQSVMSNNVLFRNLYQIRILLLPFIQHQILTIFFFESNSESDESESDFNSVFMNLDICVFFSPYIYTLLNKLADEFFYLFLKQNQMLCKQCKYKGYFLLVYHYSKSLLLSHHTIKFFYFSF